MKEGIKLVSLVLTLSWVFNFLYWISAEACKEKFHRFRMAVYVFIELNMSICDTHYTSVFWCSLKIHYFIHVYNLF